MYIQRKHDIASLIKIERYKEWNKFKIYQNYFKFIYLY